MAINGVILVNKERNVSSNKVVNKVKYAVKAEKAGHLGTLDVLGEGLLPVTLGKGTKLFDFFLQKDKVYKTVFKFGETTDTLDLEGEVTDRNNVIVSLEEVKAAAKELEGKQAQMPPIYSAKKINGKKAYDLARAGEEVVLTPKEIEIYSIKVLKELKENTYELEIHCSSGTYIRSVCRDMANKLSTYGVMLSIQRTRCGIFDIIDSFSLEDILKGNYKIISLDSLFDYEKVKLTKQQEEKVLNGVVIPYTSADKKVCLFGENDFLGIAEIQNNKLKLTLRLI